MAKEKVIEQELVKAVKKVGGVCWKFVSPGTNAVPDRIILVSLGRIAFVEVKAPGEKPRPLQVMRINQIRKLGFKVYVLDNKNQIEAIISEIIGGGSDEVHTT